MLVWARPIGLHSYGGILISTVNNASHAATTFDWETEALLVTDHEAATHGGDVTSMVLIPSLAKQIPGTPPVAAGGFTNGRGLAAALKLGADAVAMGYRYALSKESLLALPLKEAITVSTESETLYGSDFYGISARVLETHVAVKRMASRPFLGTLVYRAFMASQKSAFHSGKYSPACSRGFKRCLSSCTLVLRPNTFKRQR
jgi:enoyl-[acyl-carrier protein] reductase II